MNHKNLASTLVYLHTTQAQARAAHARLSPDGNSPTPRGETRRELSAVMSMEF